MKPKIVISGLKRLIEYRKFFLFCISVFAWFLAPAAVGQGTVKFGFEQFELGVTPPFVENLGLYQAAVANSSYAPSIPAYEGQKFLRFYGGASIGSPDGWPIESFSMRVFIPDTQSGALPGFLVTGLPGLSWRPTVQLNTWTIVQGTFEIPTRSVGLSAFDNNTGRVFGVDDVQFQTIPEPQSLWLLAGGGLALFAIEARRRHHWRAKAGIGEQRQGRAKAGT